MDFGLDQRRRDLADRVDEVCRAHCSAELEARRDASAEFPDELYRALGEAGVLGYTLPAEYGGRDGGFLDRCVIAETLGRYSTTAVSLYFVANICATMIAEAGTDAQRKRLLPALDAGELRLAFALTELQAGSDAGSITTRATIDGDHFVLDGAKLFTTGASNADYILTVARTSTERKASRGSSIVLVPANSPGLDVRPLPKIASTAHATCEVRYDSVRVPAEALLGEPHGAWPMLVRGSAVERLCIAAWLAGMARTVVDELVEFARGRIQFGQPVGRFQGVQHQIADLATEAEAMRWLTYHAAWLADREPNAARAINMAKVFGTEAGNRIVTTAMRLTGGQAFFADSALPRRLRESTFAFYAGGTLEIQRNVIARELGL
ncbi:MAG: acyl-CoA/acyl-ACP dehydrogenase [Pseudonocardia sp.]|nr:acyl-CoA/acyl-ACP dehydrogenase [Pseudonocardia sp.]MBO0873498.1 acyl-CoA/acyl-ACP dehydrogenase [Pseudonocardia sp.]